MGEQIGYARVSSTDQNLQLQEDALHIAGADRIFTDKATGARADRPGLLAALEYARPGDTIIVWKLDRLGRSLPDLIRIVTVELGGRGINFVSLTEGFDTRTAMGRFIFQVMGALAEYERELIRERTLAGLAAARANGRRGGRRPKLNASQLRQLHRMREEETPVAEIARVLVCGRATVYRALCRQP